LALLALLNAARASAAALNDWPSRQSLEVPAPGLVRFAVPSETHDTAQASLGDLRVLDPLGAEVPYLIEQPRAKPGHFARGKAGRHFSNRIGRVSKLT